MGVGGKKVKLRESAHKATIHTHTHTDEKKQERSLYLVQRRESKVFLFIKFIFVFRIIISLLSSFFHSFLRSLSHQPC